MDANLPIFLWGAGLRNNWPFFCSKISLDTCPLVVVSRANTDLAIYAMSKRPDRYRDDVVYTVCDVGVGNMIALKYA